MYGAITAKKSIRNIEQASKTNEAPFRPHPSLLDSSLVLMSFSYIGWIDVNVG